jgi:hypothetical protein
LIPLDLPRFNDKVTSVVGVNVYGLPERQVSSVYSNKYRAKYIYLHEGEIILSVAGRIKSFGQVRFGEQPANLEWS